MAGVQIWNVYTEDPGVCATSEYTKFTALEGDSAQTCSAVLKREGLCFTDMQLILKLVN